MDDIFYFNLGETNVVVYFSGDSTYTRHDHFLKVTRNKQPTYKATTF